MGSSVAIAWNISLAESVVTAEVTVGCTLSRVDVSTRERLFVAFVKGAVANGCEEACPDVSRLLIKLPDVVGGASSVDEALCTSEVVSDVSELSGTLVE